jgi:hypothetical protein
MRTLEANRVARPNGCAEAGTAHPLKAVLLRAPREAAMNFPRPRGRGHIEFGVFAAATRGRAKHKPCAKPRKLPHKAQRPIPNAAQSGSW